MSAPRGGRRVIAALDMDRTLIYSASAQGNVATSSSLRVVEHLEGRPLSRMTTTSWALLERLMTTALVVPVTTRTPEQFARIQFPVMPTYAICANGGVLLVDGVADTQWTVWAQATAARSAALGEVTAMIELEAQREWVHKYRSAQGLFCYLVATKRSEIPGKWLTAFSSRCIELGWVVSVQGRKVYAVPRGLSKAAGLLRLHAMVSSASEFRVPVYTAGDSLLDASMLVAADAAIRPAHGELHEQGWMDDAVEVTTASGIVAGEQIVGWMLRRIEEQV